VQTGRDIVRPGLPFDVFDVRAGSEVLERRIHEVGDRGLVGAIEGFVRDEAVPTGEECEPQRPVPSGVRHAQHLR
jgi:hypothetical protein